VPSYLLGVYWVTLSKIGFSRALLLGKFDLKA